MNRPAEYSETQVGLFSYRISYINNINPRVQFITSLPLFQAVQLVPPGQHHLECHRIKEGDIPEHSEKDDETILVAQQVGAVLLFGAE